MSSASVSIVVPVYNGAATLPELAERCAKACVAANHPYELILVNDGSRDNSWAVIEGLAARDPAVRGVDLMRNFGQHNAVLAGVRAAANDVIVTIDDDLQHPPESIPMLLDALRPGCDLVYGTPLRQQHSRWRNATAVASKSILRVLGGWGAADRVTDFRAFRTRLRDGFADFSAPSVSFDALLAWTTQSIAYVPVEHHPRRVGASNYRLSSLSEYAATMATTFSLRPLRLATFAGGLCAFGGAAGMVGLAIRDAVTGDALLGPGFVVALIVFFAGLQLLAVGVLGEYVGRAHQRLIAKPTYVVRSTVGLAPQFERREHRQVE
jgi:undecaprenyl-phosphate 4-deoxy-4-formamido-L-arabinose transferase